MPLPVEHGVVRGERDMLVLARLRGAPARSLLEFELEFEFRVAVLGRVRLALALLMDLGVT